LKPSGRDELEITDFNRAYMERGDLFVEILEHELGFKPTSAFETWLTETVRWYLLNRSWWRSILDRGYQAKRIGLASGEAGNFTLNLTNNAVAPLPLQV
jgi:dTDP-glucose pyrophosphorylase